MKIFRLAVITADQREELCLAELLEACPGVNILACPYGGMIWGPLHSAGAQRPVGAGRSRDCP
jgi:hypothetical protein